MADDSSARLKGWAAIILAVGGLCTAVGAVVRKPPEEAARAGYVELTKAILDSQENERKNHEDVAALRLYLDGYVRSHETLVVPLVEAGVGVPSTAGVSTVRAYAAASAAPPPTVRPLPATKPIKDVANFAW
jgi:hypothetical protein